MIQMAQHSYFTVLYTIFKCICVKENTNYLIYKYHFYFFKYLMKCFCIFSNQSSVITVHTIIHYYQIKLRVLRFCKEKNTTTQRFSISKMANKEKETWVITILISKFFLKYQNKKKAFFIWLITNENTQNIY